MDKGQSVRKKVHSIINEVDKALKTLTVSSLSERPRPDRNLNNPETLTSQEKQEHAKYMRVNHSGEICAQALYRGQLFFNNNKNKF